MSDRERELYDHLEDYSEADYPIFVDGQWLGSVGFAYNKTPLEEEYLALDAVAEMIAAYWKRNSERDRLEQSLADRTSLVAAVSHELRTPLTVIVGLTSELLDENTLLDSERHDLLTLISEQSADMSAIIEDLLIAALPDVQISVEDAPVDLLQLANDVVNSLGTTSVAVQGPEVVVQADPTRVRQVLRNLISNAIKYGEDPIRIETGSNHEFGYALVSDAGVGVDAIDAERIFAPYERAHPIDSHPGSVGLGLAVSRRLARLMGGNLVYSRTSRKTTFRFMLPQEARADRPEGP